MASNKQGMPEKRKFVDVGSDSDNETESECYFVHYIIIGDLNQSILDIMALMKRKKTLFTRSLRLDDVWCVMIFAFDKRKILIYL